MKVFASIRKSLPLIGVLEFDPLRSYFISIALLGFAYFLIFYGAITALWFAAFKAQTFDEFTKTIVSLVICVYTFMVCTVLRWRKKAFLAMFMEMEKTFGARKS